MNFRLTATYLQFPIQVCFSVTVTDFLNFDFTFLSIDCFFVLWPSNLTHIRSKFKYM